MAGASAAVARGALEGRWIAGGGPPLLQENLPGVRLRAGVLGAAELRCDACGVAGARAERARGARKREPAAVAGTSMYTCVRRAAILLVASREYTVHLYVHVASRGCTSI